MSLHQYAIYQLKEGVETRKLRFHSYQYLMKHKINICEQNYEQVYLSSALPADSVEKIWKRFIEQPPQNFTGHHALTTSDVIAYNRDGVINCYYVDKDRLVPIAGFIKLNSSAALISMDTNDFKMDNVKGNWISTDEVIVDGRQFFLMQNDYYKDNVGFMIVSAEGDIITDNAEGFTEQVLEKIRSFLLTKELKQQQQSAKELWQKFYENGEYVRSVESGTEQNYNMIDGMVNNRTGKQKTKVRTSVLEKLHQKQAEIVRRRGKAEPQMSVDLEDERNRK